MTLAPEQQREAEQRLLRIAHQYLAHKDRAVRDLAVYVSAVLGRQVEARTQEPRHD